MLPGFPFLIRGRYEDVTLHYCIMLSYRMLLCTDLYLPQPSPFPPFHHAHCHRRGPTHGTEAAQAWQSPGTFRHQHISPHNSSLICQQKTTLEQFLNVKCKSQLSLSHCLVLKSWESHSKSAISNPFCCDGSFQSMKLSKWTTMQMEKIHKCIFKNTMLIEQRVTMKWKQLGLVLANNKWHHHSTTPYFASQYLTALSSGGRRWRMRNGARTCSSLQRLLLNSTQNSVRV